MDKTGKCIIMCAGEYTRLSIDVGEDDLVIAADNGLTYLEQSGIIPDLVIGDYDSLSSDGRRILKEIQEQDPGRIVRLPVEKDDTDTLAAVREGLKRGYRSFFLYAALGGRLDHSLANIQTLNFIAENDAKGYIMDKDCMMFVLKNGERHFYPGFSGGFSVFALEKEVHGVTITGMKYNVSNITLTNSFPIGVSNHIDGTGDAMIRVEDGAVLCYVSWDS